jgi:hypothetical protein
MLLDWNLLQVLLTLFAASLIRSAFGFGEALIAVPLLALILPVNVAAPVAVLISITISGVVVIQDWRHIHLTSASWLILSTVAGIPLGLLVLHAVPEHLIKLILASIIVSFSTYSLRTRSPARLPDDRLAWIFGFLAGILGGAYGMNGPPLVIYGTLRGWSPQHFRATLQGYFLPASLMTMVGYGLTGLWTPRVFQLYGAALPGSIIAILLGRAISRHMTGNAFLKYVHLGLLVVGVLLFAQSSLRR